MQFEKPADFFKALEKNKTIKVLNIASLSQDSEDAKVMRVLLRAVRYN
jgi:mannose/fructose/N-acetylgalactosamine-specific phosphotransferase system component IIB